MKTAALALALATTAFGQSLTEVLSNSPELSSLTQLITPYAEAFGGLSNITLLAPNNNAIGGLPNATLQALAADPALLQAILNYHVLQGNYSTITNTSFIPTNLNITEGLANVSGGQRVQALASSGNVTFFSGLLQNSSVVNASIPFDQGTIHIIDRLLTLPQNLSSTAVSLNLTSVVGAIRTLELEQTLNTAEDITIFLPNNAAFQRIGSALGNISQDDLTDILQYHVVQGTVAYSTAIQNGTSIATLNENNVTLTVSDGSVFVNNARVIRPNVLIRNGVIHVIDRVLNPANETIAPDASTTQEAFPGATSAADEPYTSGVETPTSAVATEQVSSAEASASSASSSGGAERPMVTGAIGMAALFGGAAAVMNI